ncbi:MAG: hypothetical protein HYZ17_14190 [Betaproteobacteria bacterium]|jgi:hypothetical protein|nr:hypothetical protein [Betaproteobacteria bacterium]
MKLVRLAPAVVASLLAAAVGSAWLASLGTARAEGLAGSAAVALWFLGFALLALVFASVSAGVALYQLKQLTLREKLSGLLPFPVLILVFVVAFLALT